MNKIFNHIKKAFKIVTVHPENSEDIDKSFRTIIESAPDAFFQADQDGYLILVNKKATELTGYSKKELLSMNVAGLFPSEILKERPLRFDLLKKGEEVKIEREILRKKGGCVQVEMHSKALPDGTYQSFVRDITERKKVEEAIRVSEARLQQAELTSKAGNWELHLDTQTIVGSVGAAKIYGVDAGNFDYSMIKNVPLPEYRPLLDLALKELIENNKPYDIEFKIKKLDSGEIRDIHSIATYQRDKRILFGVIQDITERKQAETALKKSESFLNDVIKQNPNSMWISDETGTLIRINKACLNLLNISEDEVLGKYNILNDNIVIDQGFLPLVKSVYEKGDCVRFELTYDSSELKQLELSNFVFVILEVNIFPIKDEAGKVINAVIQHNNITARKRAELDLIAAKEKAEENDRLKTAFLQNLSHEVRTPMNAIMGFSELIVDELNNRGNLVKYATIINQRSNDLLDIINDILDIAKIESGQLPVNTEECNINLLFEELTSIFTDYRDRMGKQHIKFDLQPVNIPDGNIILTDMGKLKQILINLISNAFKFTREGTIQGGCRIENDHNLLFYVKDTGIGIPSDKYDAIYERFVQLDQGKLMNAGGTGLGLSIVRGLVNLLGGEIFLESESGKGTVFYFTIPFVSPQQTKPEVEPDIEKHIIENLSEKTILVVEDDIYNTEYLKEVLSGMGLKVIQAETGREAVEIAITRSIDLVLMDIRLPDINGYEATRQIRKHKPKLKIIAQTAYASYNEKQIAVGAGCNDYLSKPIRKDTLLSLLNKHFSKMRV